MSFDPVVFISSTVEDLKEHREQAAAAARACGFSPRMMEYFPSSGHKPSLAVCLDEVSKAEVVVVLVAERYGWVPDDSTNTDAKSITWMECDHARNVTKKEVLAFLLDAEYKDWPLDQRENYRLVKERDKEGISKEVERNEKKLKQFKGELNQYVRSSFTDPASVRHLVSDALSAWRERNHQAVPSTDRHDPDTYLRLLEDDTRQIRIKALKTKRAEPYVFNIDEIYISLTTLSGQDPSPQDPSKLKTSEKRGIALEKALSQRKLVIVGDPGSGKSTFLRRVAFELCRNLRGTRPTGAAPFLPADDMRFPILIRIADLAKLLTSDSSSKPPDSPDWLPYFLGKQSAEFKWGVSEKFFQEKLDGGGCLVMIDGLDEAPERRMRERIARLFESATRTFEKCDFLVSTRPSTNEGDSVLAGFQQLRIGELELPEIEIFFGHFAKALALPEAEAKLFGDGLHLALSSRVEIREMAANPVMLTALAVLQHNDQRLPEYRVDLFGSILSWLAAAREYRPDRPQAEECLKQMRKLALHMQDAPNARLAQINKRTAAEFFTLEFGGNVDANEEMLERETNESGIISSVGTDLKFWHLSFQEYLAALEIGGLTEAQQIERVVSSGRLYEPEWRETMRLLGGVLFKQGEAKVEGLFQAILSKLGPAAKFPDQVRCAALLSAMMRDLSRMKYKPKTPDYERTVKAVMGIFEKGEAEKIEIEKRIEAAELLAQVGDPRLDDENWITIPGGTFRMGAQNKDKKGANYDPEAYDDESPVHEVTLRGFRIRRFPVTVQEFGNFIKAKGYSTPKYWTEGYGKVNPENWERQKQHPTRPVVGVSWFECAAYCAWANCRLPTEAEWERVARGPHSWKHPWGDAPPLDPSYANYRGIEHPTPVGLFPKGHTFEEVCDMLGNVYEWCSDWYGSYREGTQNSPPGPDSDDTRLLRGGCWVSDPRYVRVSVRNWSEPSDRSNGLIGFRCAGELR